MRFQFHPEALAEYDAAARFYAKRQKGLQRRFIVCFENALRQISVTPDRWRHFEDDVRRCLVRVFPFAILYSIESDYILIIAVMHCSREPGYGRDRIQDPGERE